MSGRADPIDALRGASRLAVEATAGIADLVEALHRTIAGRIPLVGGPFVRATRPLSTGIYATVRGLARGVGAVVDAALAPLTPAAGEGASAEGARGEGASGPCGEAVRAALNGVLGDHLSASGNPLAITMRLRTGGNALRLERQALRERFPAAGGRLLVLVHGCALSDLQWSRHGHDHGAALGRELGLAAVYLHYNSGLHVSTNGRLFADLLERLVAAWPVPVEELAILGHSMGGLVARSACQVAEAAGHAWRGRLRHLVFLGTPHHGSPVERAGNWLGTLAGLSAYGAPFARAGRMRSAGITDLRFGNVLDEHWQGRDRFAQRRDDRHPLRLPAGVACHALAATRARQLGPRLPGDGLVPVDSALGRHADPLLVLGFPDERVAIALGAGHLDLLHRLDVYATIRSWLAGEPAPALPA